MQVCQWCLWTRDKCSGNPPESIMSQLGAMDFDINKKDTQEGDDMVDQNLDKPKMTWTTRPNTARLEELRERLRQVKKELIRTADVAKKQGSDCNQ